jgi:hypothetical protein
MGEHLGTKLDSVPESIKSAVLNRMVDSQFVDLFQYYELMPENVSATFNMYYEMNDNEWSYDSLSKLESELKELGYTFDYGLDAEPYGLRPIELSLNQLKDFEEYKNGGSIYNKGRSWHLDRQKYNKSESWEKPMRKRKKRYETGGGVGEFKNDGHGNYTNDEGYSLIDQFDGTYQVLDADGMDIVGEYLTLKEGKQAIKDYMEENEKYAKGGGLDKFMIGDLVFAKDEGMNGLVGLVISDARKNEDGVMEYDILYRGYSGDIIPTDENDIVDIRQGYMDIAQNKSDISSYTSIAEKRGITINPVYQQVIDEEYEYKDGGSVKFDEISEYVKKIRENRKAKGLGEMTQKEHSDLINELQKKFNKYGFEEFDEYVKKIRENRKGLGEMTQKEHSDLINELQEKFNKYAKGGGINSGRDNLFKSQEPHEQRYKRKREWKEYKKEGWFGDWFRDGGVILMEGDMVKIMPNYPSIYTNEKAQIVREMPDGKTYEVKIRHKTGNEYQKFDKSELVFLGNEPKWKLEKGGGVGIDKNELSEADMIFIDNMELWVIGSDKVPSEKEEAIQYATSKAKKINSNFNPNHLLGISKWYAKGGGVGEIDMNDIEKQANFYTDESRWTTKPTIEKFDKEIMEYQDLKLQLDNNQIRPSKIIGTGFKPQYARPLAYKWINERILVAKRAIEILIERQKQSKEGDISNLQKKIDYINKNYDGVTASKTYSDNRIQVVSPYFNTLNEIKRKEFEGSGLMERYGNTSSYVLYSNNIYEMGGGMDDYTKSLGMVRVKFTDPKYNYETNVSGTITEEKARNYFVGKMFDVGTYPNENMQKVIDIDFYPKGSYANGGGVGNFSEYSNDALTDAIINLSRFENTEDDIKTLKEELKKRKESIKLDSEEEMVKSNLYNGEISCEKLTEIIGCKPNYPYQIVGAIKLEKCYLRPYYKLV